MNSQKSPLVSVVTPVYNSQAFLNFTIESLIQQSYAHWELLCVIDSGSSDESEALARLWAARDQRVRVIKSPYRGVAATRNYGLQAAVGSYIAFLDSDDIWLPEKLSYQLSEMRKTGSLFSCMAFRRVDVANTRMGRKISVPASISYSRLLEQNCILCSSVMIDRQLDDALSFPDVPCEDFALWLKLLKSGVICLGLPRDLVRYRIVPNSYGSSKWRSYKATWNIYRRQEKLNPLPALSLLARFTLRGLEKYSRF